MGVKEEDIRVADGSEEDAEDKTGWTMEVDGTPKGTKLRAKKIHLRK